jgi:protocatechuate 3,4-dioxygenase beta subunit
MQRANVQVLDSQPAPSIDPDPDAMTDDSRTLLRRREALGLFGVTAAATAVGARATGFFGDTPPAAAAATCVLSPEVTEGPYWIENTLTRRDIREDKTGLPLLLSLTVQNASACTPIAKADVEIWHCDAAGVYSGYEGASTGGMGGTPPTGTPPTGTPPTGTPPAGGGGGGDTAGGHQTPTSSTHYLRGHQVSSETGKVTFITIVPGWYAGRTPHIHLKVHVGGQVIHTGQIFFSEKTLAEVYKVAPYSSHGQPDTSHAADNIFAQAGGDKAVVKLARRARGKKGYTGAITLGVAT